MEGKKSCPLAHCYTGQLCCDPGAASGCVSAVSDPVRRVLPLSQYRRSNIAN
jgi:hypothetical protein